MSPALYSLSVWLRGVIKRVGLVLLYVVSIPCGILFYVAYGLLLCAWAPVYWLLTGKNILNTKFNIIDL